MDTLPVAEHSWLMKSKHGESTSERLLLSVIDDDEMLRVPGELLFRVTTGHVTLLRPFLYVIDFKRALSFGEAQAHHRGSMVKENFVSHS
jgi:hypothetical protein